MQCKFVRVEYQRDFFDHLRAKQIRKTIASCFEGFDFPNDDLFFSEEGAGTVSRQPFFHHRSLT